MMSVVVRLSPAGCIEELRASGHAGEGRRGGNVVCAAATALLRTAADVLSARTGVRCEGEAPAEGELRFSVKEVPTDSLEWARGVTDFLLQGCGRIGSEAPEAVSVQILRRG
jgi:uncharacterized protein YsxB (DUF464 family)